MNYQEQAIAYLRGDMNAEQQARFEDELTRSEELRTELQTARALLDMLDAASEDSMIRMVNAHVQQAIGERASDIHIVPGMGADSGTSAGDEAGATTISFRVDGLLRRMAHVSTEQHRALVDRWKVMANLDLREQRVPQDGRVALRIEQGEFDLRVSILPTVAGERVTVRILDRARILPALDALGMDTLTFATVRRLVERPHGLVILAGTTHSGKTTTAYALLRHLQTFGAGRSNIMTVEHLIEHRLEGISQTAVNRQGGLTYPSALQSIMRSDPDVVYVGAMRDEETAQLCIELAVTGHFTLSQLNVGGAIQTVQRLRDMGVENHLLASNLSGSVGLRLLRRVCPHCAVAYEPARSDLARAGLSLVEDGPFQRGTGCGQCRNTGYKGRIGLFEAWEVTPRLRALVAERADADTLWNESFGGSGGSLWDDAREKIRQGLITVEDAAWALFDYPHPRRDSRAAQPRPGLIDLSEL